MLDGNYVKQLEERIEELQDELVATRSVIHLLSLWQGNHEIFSFVENCHPFCNSFYQQKSWTKTQKDNNARRSKWAFFQLRQYIDYKAKLSGVPVLYINPAFTSQKCSTRGHTCEENRLTQAEFKCVSCGFEANADFNASINISRASINKPIVTAAELQTSRSLA